MNWGDIILSLLLLGLVAYLLWTAVYSRRARKTQKEAITSNDKPTDSNIQLANAINHLAEVIENKR